MTKLELVHPGQLNPRVTVSALPDDVLLEVFGFCVDTSEEYGDDRVHQGKWLTLVHVCTMAMCRFRITTKLGSATFLHPRYAGQENVRYLARVAYRHLFLPQRIATTRRDQHHSCAQATGSRV